MGRVYLTKTWNDPYDWQYAMERENGHGGCALPSDLCAKVFTNSLADFFDSMADNRSVCPRGYESAPSTALMQHRSLAVNCGSTLWRDCAWRLIKDTPNLVYQILTKRPENILDRLPKDWGEGYPNVWLGVSTGCLKTLDKLDKLRQVPVHPKAVRFVSCEPLLEDIAPNIDLSGISWLIAGGESGNNPEYLYGRETHQDGRRTMRLSWARNLKRLCYTQNTPFFFKRMTASQQGVGEDALGEIYHECPPPYGRWATDEEWDKLFPKKGKR